VLALGVALILLALGPFAGALEIHHQLAAADQDGHQHSETDLCQWVQHHTGSSLQIEVPAVESPAAPSEHEFLFSAILPSASLIDAGPSRAPPLS
jgi:hypothetical protein